MTNCWTPPKSAGLEHWHDDPPNPGGLERQENEKHVSGKSTEYATNMPIIVNIGNIFLVEVC